MSSGKDTRPGKYPVAAQRLQPGIPQRRARVAALEFTVRASPFSITVTDERAELQEERLAALQRLDGGDGMPVGQHLVAGIDAHRGAHQQVAGDAFRRDEGDGFALVPDGNRAGLVQADHPAGGDPALGRGEQAVLRREGDARRVQGGGDGQPRGAHLASGCR